MGAGGECDEPCCNVLDYIKTSVFCADRYFVEIFGRLSGRLRQAFFFPWRGKLSKLSLRTLFSLSLLCK